MSGSWQGRIENLASNLLTLEVNTAIKPGMVAQKMPELPVALHVVIETYADGLRQAGTPLTRELVRAAAAHIRDDKTDPQDQRIKVDILQKWFSKDAPRPPGWARDDTPAAELTNGAEMFEAMQWAAFGALATKSWESGNLDNAEVNLRRIRSNSRQLRSAAILLEQQYSSGDPAHRAARKQRGESDIAEAGAAGYLERLDAVRKNSPAVHEPRRLFGGTLEQTADALFKQPRPTVRIAPDLAVLVRKAWDVGLENVLFQTAVQLDGDVLVRMSDQIMSDPVKAEHRQFLHALHQQAVNEGTGQWKLLFQTAGELVRETGLLLFGRTGQR